MLQNDNKANEKKQYSLEERSLLFLLITCKSKLMISLLCFEKQELGRDFFCEIRAERKLKLFPARNSTIICNCTATAEEKPSKRFLKSCH